MKHKEVVTAIAAKLNQSEQETAALLDHAVNIFRTQLSEGNSVLLSGFGSFEVKRKEERISVHPSTKVRTLIPPKQVVSFKQSAIFKQKLKEVPHAEG